MSGRALRLRRRVWTLASAQAQLLTWLVSRTPVLVPCGRRLLTTCGRAAISKLDGGTHVSATGRLKHCSPLASLGIGEKTIITIARVHLLPSISILVHASARATLSLLALVDDSPAPTVP